MQRSTLASRQPATGSQHSDVLLYAGLPTQQCSCLPTSADLRSSGENRESLCTYHRSAGLAWFLLFASPSFLCTTSLSRGLLPLNSQLPLLSRHRLSAPCLKSSAQPPPTTETERRRRAENKNHEERATRGEGAAAQPTSEASTRCLQFCQPRPLAARSAPLATRANLQHVLSI